MKKILAIVLTFVLCFGVLSLAFAAEDEAIAAVPDGYTGIYTAEDLDNIRNNLSGKYILMNDIDLSSYENWNPIGASDIPFTGELDGNGYAVENMTISVTHQEILYTGLFGVVENATVKNLTIDNGNIDAIADNSIYAGLVCGECKGSYVLNCKTYGSINSEISGIAYVGGIVGNAYESQSKNSFIKDCANFANVAVTAYYKNADYFNSFCVGGIAGSSGAFICECSNHGNITASEIKNTEDSYSSVYAGGICGNQIYNFLKNCYNTGNISSTGLGYAVAAGGIAGSRLSHYEFSCLYNTGNVSAANISGKESRREYYGAIVGIQDSLVYIPETPKGEMLPFVYAEYCYYSDNVDKPFEYFDEEKETTIKMLSADEFRNKKSFEGFDFENIWEMEENGYPVLKNTPVIPEDEEDENSTTEITTEPTTESTTVTVTEPTTSETTTETDPSSTETTTENNKTTHPATETSTKEATIPESTTEPTTEPDDMEECWLIKIINKTIYFFVWLFSVLGF